MNKAANCFTHRPTAQFPKKRGSADGGLKMSINLALLAAPAQPFMVGGVLAAIVAAAWYWLAVPSRTYVEGDGTVGKEYDAWTEEGILEYYWVS
jgi:hypothetical protein